MLIGSSLVLSAGGQFPETAYLGRSLGQALGVEVIGEGLLQQCLGLLHGACRIGQQSLHEIVHGRIQFTDGHRGDRETRVVAVAQISSALG